MAGDEKPFCVIGGECIGNVPTIAELNYYINKYISEDPKLNLADLNERDHVSLENVLAEQHHVKTVSSEISLGEMAEKDHANLTDVLTSQHHVKTVASELNLNDMAEKSHDSLGDLYSDNHHAKTVASELNLNDMAEKSHISLTGILTGQHHAKTVSSEISLASMAEKGHVSLTGVLTSQHHVKTVASELNLNDMAEKSHDSLTDLYSNNHHEKTVASELNLNDMAEKSHVSLTGVSTSQHHVKTVASELNLVDLQASANKLFYVNDAGVITELALGSAGKFLKSLGESVSPGWGWAGVGIASNTIIHSNDMERELDSDVYAKMKEIIIHRNLKNVRVSWEYKGRTGMNNTYTRVYVNGVAVGAEHSKSSDTYSEVYSDISNVYAGDLIQVYGKKDPVETFVDVRNMKIKYDVYVNNDP